MIAPAAPRSLFGPHAIDALDDDSVGGPAPLDFSEDARAGASSRADLAYERPRHGWAPIDPAPPVDGLPVRFIDGTIATRLAGSLTVDGRRRPIVAATIAAAALELRDRATLRLPGAVTRKVVALYQDGIDRIDLDRAAATLRAQGIDLLLREMDAGQRDFDMMREATKNRAMDAMEAAERDVLLQAPSIPTLVDGLLERRLVGVPDRSLPVVGMVKRHAAIYLPADLQELLYRLRPGQRTPAFVLEVDKVPLVNIYVRLSTLSGASPSAGVVRVTAPLAFVDGALGGEARPRYLSALAGYLHRLRCRDEGYARAGVSLEPVVRVETHLHAIRPGIETLVSRLHRLFADRSLDLGNPDGSPRRLRSEPSDLGLRPRHDLDSGNPDGSPSPSDQGRRPRYPLPEVSP